jgi:hypothetical protein
MKILEQRMFAFRFQLKRLLTPCLMGFALLTLAIFSCQIAFAAPKHRGQGYHGGGPQGGYHGGYRGGNHGPYYRPGFNGYHGGVRYYGGYRYFGPNYYGTYLPTLPYRCSAISHRGYGYYYCGRTYYRPYRRGFMVVAPPY